MKFYIKLKDNIVVETISEKDSKFNIIDTASWIENDFDIPLGFEAISEDNKYKFSPSEKQIFSWLWHEEGNQWVKTGYVMDENGFPIKEKQK